MMLLFYVCPWFTLVFCTRRNIDDEVVDAGTMFHRMLQYRVVDGGKFENLIHVGVGTLTQ